MAVSDEYTTFVLDQLAVLGEVTARRMFGGMGLWTAGTFFALIADDVLYFKVDDTNRADYEAEGTGPFVPFADGRMTMQYYEVPADILESREQLEQWARKALAVALKAKKPKKRSK